MNIHPDMPRALPRLETDNLVLRYLDPREAPLITRFRVENRQHLLEWEPARRIEYYTENFWEVQLRAMLREFRAGNSVCLTILNTDERQVLGVCNYTNIVRGTFQSCHLGYAVAGSVQGQGVMQEALVASNAWIFRELRLHRIMANYLPRNTRSGRLLEKLGFEKEGLAKSFLRINGRWEDHVLTSLINPADIRTG